MVSLTVVASAMFLSWSAMDTLPDTLPALQHPIAGPALPATGLGLADLAPTAGPDSLQQQRRKAVTYSDWYYRRLTWHKRLSWAMLPLFAASYVSGNEMLSKGGDAPEWARTIHGPAATGSAALFGINTVTGTWNLWEGRHESEGRARRITHALLFTAASGGFVYAGTKLADDAQESQSKRRQHRNVALGSMGVSTASWLLMLIGN